VWGRIRHSLARKPSVDSIGGVLLAAHSLHPVVVPRVAQCHAALELVHGSRGVFGRCRPAALQEERVGFHLAHQIVAAHDGLVVGGACKNSSSVLNPARCCAMQIDDNCWVALPIYCHQSWYGARSQAKCTPSMHVMKPGRPIWRNNFSSCSIVAMSSKPTPEAPPTHVSQYSLRNHFQNFLSKVERAEGLM